MFDCSYDFPWSNLKFSSPLHCLDIDGGARGNDPVMHFLRNVRSAPRDVSRRSDEVCPPTICVLPVPALFPGRRSFAFGAVSP
jgi:hypothetical protein